jgi:signal recognition particle subunit SRP54
MFESLTEKLNHALKNLTGRGKLTAENIADALKEVRLALLEADVNYKIVKKLIEDIRQRAVGTEVLDSLTPGQQVIKIVNEELTRLMGEARQELVLTGKTPFTLMLVGLQGSGKTTTAGKLAQHLRTRGRNPYLVPADVYRPAAIEQLKKLGSQLGVPVYLKPEEICLDALSRAGGVGADVLIVDTAGRLHIDDALMAELARIKERIEPTEILLVADAMTGQDAVNMAQHFNELLDINILTSSWTSAVSYSPKWREMPEGVPPYPSRLLQGSPLNLSVWGKSWMPLSPSSRIGWPPGSWVWGTCSH